MPNFAAAAPVRPPANPPSHVRVLVVDDSAIIRGVIARWLESEPAIRVTSTAATGLMAIRAASLHEFDVAILDIEMPELDGLSALPKMLEAQPGLQVVMASTLTLRNASVSMRALELGAADYIPKPQNTRLVTGGQDFRRELIDKVYALADVARRLRGQPCVKRIEAPAADTQAPAAPCGDSGQSDSTPACRPAPQIPRNAAIKLARLSQSLPQMVVIGSSTGGPQALFSVLGALGQLIGVPVLIAQHMPPTFTAILAQHINRLTGLPCVEAAHGMKALPGHAYVAPGDRHMTVTGSIRVPELALSDGPPENYCRPAVDPLFRSAADLFGPSLLGVVLTGMGQDGAYGAQRIIERGGSVFVQDEASSVVWGMPGAAAHLGAASRILPLSQIGDAIKASVEGKYL